MSCPIKNVILEQRTGDDFSWSGRTTLPVGSWTAQIDFLDAKSNPIANAGGLSSVVTAIPNTVSVDGLTQQFLIRLSADHTATAAWPGVTSRTTPVTLTVYLRFVGPITKSAKNAIEIRATK